jgi:hypothetical protein
MSSLRKEIEAEMTRTRLDKGRLFDLLLKIADNAGPGGVGPQGPAGPAGPAGAQGPIGECKCVPKEVAPKEVAPKAAAPAPKAVATPKKVPVKKNVVVSA